MAGNLFQTVLLRRAQSFEMPPSRSNGEIYSKLVIFTELIGNFH